MGIKNIGGFAGTNTTVSNGGFITPNSVANSSGFFNSLNNALSKLDTWGPTKMLGGFGGLLSIGTSLASGNVGNTVVGVASMLTNFIPGIGPLLSPVVGWVGGKVLGWLRKRKAKNAAKKFQKQINQIIAAAQQQINAINADQNLTPEQKAAKIAEINTNKNNQIIAKWNGLSDKDRERIQQYAGNVPACATALRAVSDAQIENNNIEYNRLINSWYTPSLGSNNDLLQNILNDPNYLNKRHRDANLSWKGLTSDANGQPHNAPVTHKVVVDWANEALKNSLPDLSVDSFDATKHTAAEIQASTAQLKAFYGKLQAESGSAGHPLVQKYNGANFDDPAVAKQFLTEFEAIADKVGAYEDAGKTDEEIRALVGDADFNLMQSADKAEGELALANPNAVQIVIDSFKLPITIAEYNASLGADPGEKLANALMAKADGKVDGVKDGVINRDEWMRGMGLDKNIVAIYDELEKFDGVLRPRLNIDEFVKWFEEFKKNGTFAAVDYARFFGNQSLTSSGSNDYAALSQRLFNR